MCWAAEEVVGVKTYIAEIGNGLVEFMAIGTAVSKQAGVAVASPALPVQAIIRDKDTWFDGDRLLSGPQRGPVRSVRSVRQEAGGRRQEAGGRRQGSNCEQMRGPGWAMNSRPRICLLPAYGWSRLSAALRIWLPNDGGRRNPTLALLLDERPVCFGT